MQNKEYIEKVFGLELPVIFETVLEKLQQYETPLTLEFPKSNEVLEIQFLVDIKDSKNHRIVNGMLTFAVSYDGHDLMVDLKNEDFELYQDESGDVYELDLNAADLLSATKVE